MSCPLEDAELEAAAQIQLAIDTAAGVASPETLGKIRALLATNETAQRESRAMIAAARTQIAELELKAIGAELPSGEVRA